MSERLNYWMAKWLNDRMRQWVKGLSSFSHSSYSINCCISIGNPLIKIHPPNFIPPSLILFLPLHFIFGGKFSMVVWSTNWPRDNTDDDSGSLSPSWNWSTVADSLRKYGFYSLLIGMAMLTIVWWRYPPMARCPSHVALRRRRFMTVKSWSLSTAGISTSPDHSSIFDVVQKKLLIRFSTSSANSQHRADLWTSVLIFKRTESFLKAGYVSRKETDL
jgi:hypothetical protein